MSELRQYGVVVTTAAALMMVLGTASASSHREAPFITSVPQVDGTDFYMFRSYDGGATDRVTMIANYLPLQAPGGGPNYFDLDEDAVYEIHIDNTGNAEEDITFQFDFETVTNDIQLDIGGQMVSVPLKNVGGIGPDALSTDKVQVRQTYSVDIIRGDRRTGDRQTLTNLRTGGTDFRKPLDNIGDKSIGDYEAYADDHVYAAGIPGCMDGQVFVGQRREGFSVNLGEIFDLVNLNPLEDRSAADRNDLTNVNVTSLAIEVPVDCLTGSGASVIGGWTTASKPQARVLNPQPNEANGGRGATVQGGPFTQVSRLGHPLVNEVVIGLKDKDRFNASEPRNDSQFATYVTNPTLPALLNALFGVEPPALPRNDLVSVFLTGVEGLNQPANPTAAELLRLNTDIAPKPAADQNPLGVLAGDTAGFPNGRRPGDDVVDISLRAMMGALYPDAGDPDGDAPDGDKPFTDGANISAGDFDTSFPYLETPLPGATGS